MTTLGQMTGSLINPLERSGWRCKHLHQLSKLELVIDVHNVVGSYVLLTLRVNSLLSTLLHVFVMLSKLLIT